MKNIYSAILVFIICFSPIFANAQNDHYTVGVITALTGRMSVIGTAVKNGVELARTDRPELFRNIDFIYEDDQFDGKQSLSAYQKLKSTNHLSLVMGFGDTLGYVVGNLAERDKIPLINFNFEAGPAKDKVYLIRAMNHTEQYMQALADYLISKGENDFFLVRTESPFFNAMSSSFKNAVGSRGTINEFSAFNPDQTDFRAVLLRLKSKLQGSIGLFLSPDQLIEFMKQAKELHITGKYFGTDLFETSAGIVPETHYFENCLYPDNNVSDLFRLQYRKKFGNEAQLTFAGSAYDMAMLLTEVLGKSDNGVIDNLNTIKDRSGVLGKFSMVQSRQFGKFFKYPVVVKGISNGIGVPVK